MDVDTPMETPSEQGTSDSSTATSGSSASTSGHDSGGGADAEQEEPVHIVAFHHKGATVASTWRFYVPSDERVLVLKGRLQQMIQEDLLNIQLFIGVWQGAGFRELNNSAIIGKYRDADGECIIHVTLKGENPTSEDIHASESEVDDNHVECTLCGLVCTVIPGMEDAERESFQCNGCRAVMVESESTAMVIDDTPVDTA